MFFQFNRRRFLRASVAGGALALVGPRPAGWAAEQDASMLVAGKDSRLIVHNAKTLELETPLDLLRDYEITPAKVLFIRNNQDLAHTRTIKPLNAENWRFDVIGMVEYPRTVDLTRLHDMEQTEVEMVLQCSGNGRANFRRSVPAKGAQWTDGAVGNVRFRGVKLAALFDKLDLNISPDAHYLTAEGKDGPPDATTPDFEHSLPLDDVLARSIVALEMNGEPIPAVHGGPVRLITPGYYGTMQVKWLTRLRLETRETFNHHQRRRYRTPRTPIKPGSDFTYDFDTGDANWRMRIKSTIFAPLNGETVKAGNVEVRGVAWNDGEVKITAVEVSLDDGHTWRQTNLQPSGGPYAWHPWSTTVTLKAGKQRLLARAIDALGRTQPIDGAIGWNPAGYGWNGVQQVEVTVS